jgi:serine/threonine protein kinase
VYVYHRDLKPENILIDKRTNKVVLADLGLARMSTRTKDDLMYTTCGSPHYCAPELFNLKEGQGYDAKAAEVWQLGIILFTLTCGHLPWRNSDHMGSLFAEIKVGTFTIPDDVDKDLYRLIRGMTTVDVKKRWTMDDICGHTIFDEVCAEVCRSFPSEAKKPKKQKKSDEKKKEKKETSTHTIQVVASLFHVTEDEVNKNLSKYAEWCDLVGEVQDQRMASLHDEFTLATPMEQEQASPSSRSTKHKKKVRAVKEKTVLL